MMDVRKPTVSSDDVLCLIQALFKGEMEPSDFRLRISQYSKTTVKNLFRDSIPQFTTSLRDKITTTFTRYFFTETNTESNELWRFVDSKDFWIQLKTYHDTIYDRSLNFKEVTKYFEEKVLNSNRNVKLDYLEQKVIEKMDKNPSILNKTLAIELNVSEKKISNVINNLRKKGILLGSLANFASLDSFEFFEIGRFETFDEDVIFLDKYLLFPDFKILHGVSSKKPTTSSVLLVRNKKTFCNTKILNMGISMQDWGRQTKQMQSNSSFFCEKESCSFYVTPSSRNYILQLARNCELDFKHPKITEIADYNDVSVRTLFRIKSKLKEQGVVLPRIIIENKDLMEVLLISNIEPLQFYNIVPFVRSYEVKDVYDNIKWFVFLSIFPDDFRFLYSTISRKSEILQIFQIMKKKKVSLIDKQKLSPLPSNQKIYTK